MKNKTITIVLGIILLVVPLLIAPAHSYGYNIYKIVTLLICGALLLVITLSRGRKLQVDATDKFIFIFGALAILSTIFSQDIKTSIFGIYNRYEGILTILTYILIYYNAKYYFINYKHFSNIVMFVYSSICIWAIIQFYIYPFAKLPSPFGQGANGTFGNTNFMGSFISLILPAFILKYIFTGDKKYLLSSILNFYVMIVCVARSCWVAFAVSILVIITYLIITKKKEFWKRFFVLLVMFVMCFCTINFTTRGNTVTNKISIMTSEIRTAFESGITEKMGSSRIQIWLMTLKVICHFPILGCGVDALKYGLQDACPIDNLNYIYTYKGYIDKAHNEYLNIGATMGIPALFIYLGFLSLIVIPNMQKALKDEKCMLFFTIIISYLAQAFFNISTIGVAPMFWFILGLASKHISKEPVNE